MALCIKCRTIDVQKVLEEGVQLYINWKSLLESASSCRICAFAVSQHQAHLRAQYYTAVTKYLSEVSSTLEYRLVSSLREVDPLSNADWYHGHDLSTVLEGYVEFTEQLVLRITFGARSVQIHDAPTWEWDGDKFALKNPCSTYNLPYFRFTDEPFIQGYQSTVHRNIPSTHSEAFSWARDIWNGCMHHHDACQPSMNSKGLPRRLLSLAELETGIVSVVSTTYIEVSAYATLSYCWGEVDDQEWAEYLHKIQNSSLVFECSKLPLTIQDAITVASSLGLEYLWVDALCILQHSTHDWEEEGSRMGGIFAGCAIMISASNSHNSKQGFLQNREAIDRCVTGVELQTDDTALQVQVEISSMAYAQDVATGSLASRAWCLQEHRLAPRVLHFGKKQLHYECAYGRWEERGLQSDPTPATDVTQQSKAVGAHGYNTSGKKLTSGLTSVSQWNLMVEEYTKRRLSHGSDKLIALSGLASKACESLQCNYLAGVLQDRLHIGLSWYAAPTWIAIDSDTVLLSQQAPEIGMGRATQYRAPSWSWASTDGPVTFLLNAIDEPRTIISSIHFIEAAVRHTSSSQFGSVGIAKLTISGVLKAIPADLLVANIRLKQHNMLKDPSTRNGWYIADEGDLLTGNLLCLKLATLSHEDLKGAEPECIFLVLEQLESGEYTRRGAGSIFQLDYFDDAPEGTITLI